MESLSNLANLQQAVRNGTAMGQFPVGTEIPDSWKDIHSEKEYNIPLIVVSYRQVVGNDGLKRPGAVLLRKMALPRERPYNDCGCEYGSSAIHQYLNLDYAAGCSKELLDVATVSKIRVDEGAILAKFFLPSTTEMNRSNGDASTRIFDYQVWEYFLYDECNRSYRHTFEYAGVDFCVPADFWLRSRYCPEEDPMMRYVCCISESGHLSRAKPSANLAVLPACVVC